MRRERRLSEWVGQIEQGGEAGLAGAAARLAAVQAMGHVPDAVGPAVPVAPARGPIRVFDVMAAYPKGANGFEFRAAGYRGRSTLQVADVFDEMAARSAARGRRLPLSIGHIAMARWYRDLFERHASAGIKCSSIEGGGGGGGDPVDFVAAVLADRDRLDQLRRRIGKGSSQYQIAARGGADAARLADLADRRIVDAVCLGAATIHDALRAHGLAARGENVRQATRALADALDRMAGPINLRAPRVWRAENQAAIW